MNSFVLLFSIIIDILGRRWIGTSIKKKLQFNWFKQWWTRLWCRPSRNYQWYRYVRYDLVWKITFWLFNTSIAWYYYSFQTKSENWNAAVAPEVLVEPTLPVKCVMSVMSVVLIQTMILIPRWDEDRLRPDLVTLRKYFLKKLVKFHFTKKISEN